MTDLQRELHALPLSNFRRTTVKQFNKHFCDGNPIMGPDDATVYFHRMSIGMVTVCKDNGMWMCEVTGSDGSTGIAQSDFHNHPEDAWCDTKRQLLAL